ncbi:MAG: hypothetical protein VXZ72_02280 [Chlamydiota bacterium]|nr:hypothetical protein [Chlamydiota bacterium]
MATPAPQQHPAAPMPVAVEVNEEYGYRRYVNKVADPNNPKHSELGPHLDVGPLAVTHRVHYHMDEINSSLRTPVNAHLTREQIKNVVLGKRDYIGTATEAACDELGMPIKGRACTLPMLRDVWQQKVREAMFNGEILGPPSWLEEAEREDRYNRACSGGDFEARRKLVYELVLDGYVNEAVYRGLKPNYSEIASMCSDVVNCESEDLLLWETWRAILEGLSTENQHYVYGVITGKVVARNEFALDFMCMQLADPPEYDLTPVRAHALHAKRAWEDRFVMTDDPEFQRILLNAEVIARANYYGDEEFDDEAFELWNDLITEYFYT